MLSRAVVSIVLVGATASCGGSKTAATCASDDLDCFMSHLVIQDAAGNGVQVSLVDTATVNSLSAATRTSSTAPQLTSGPPSLPFAYGTIIEGADVPLTDLLVLSFTDPNGCQPIVGLTLSKNGKPSSHTGCFPGLRDHRTSGSFTRSLGFTANAPDGANFDLQMVVISTAGCTSIDNPPALFTTNGTYAAGAVAGARVSIPVTIAPPPSTGSSGSSGSCQLV